MGNKQKLIYTMNPEKLAKLQAEVRTGGKGTQRRKKKVVHKVATVDDKKIQNTLKKLSVNQIPGIEAVNMFRDDGSVIHFNNPKCQASLNANTWAITGAPENKQITELLPDVLHELGREGLANLRNLAAQVPAGGMPTSMGGDDDGDDDVPDLVENFDEASKDQM